MFTDFAARLRHRKGGAQLAGIDVYYDFDWKRVFRDPRARFKNGKRLALLVQSDCPAGKTAALVLTTRDDAEEDLVETSTHYATVVRIDQYLTNATSDPAAAYFAKKLNPRLTNTSMLRELAENADVLSSVFDKHLNLAVLARWLKADTNRLYDTRVLVDQLASDARLEHAPIDPKIVAETIRTYTNLGVDLLDALQVLLAKDIDKDAKVDLLTAITADASGRSAAGKAIGARIHDRIKDVRMSSEIYTQLLGNNRTNETDLQVFIQEHPWVVGLEYTHVRHQKQIPRGRLDFVLEKYNGFYDILELKSPQDPIIESPEIGIDGIPAPDKFSLSATLGQALAQVHVYRDVLTSTSSDNLQRLYGLGWTRVPRILIVIGQIRLMPEHTRRVLEQLNTSFNRVEIIPYDLLAQRANMFLSNVEKYLSVDASGAI